jgi:signal transduction histidine kinase
MESLIWPADGERADMQSAVRRLAGLALEIDAREVFFVVSKELGRVVNSDAAWLIHGSALRHAERANAELRELVHGILPASLSRAGLRSGIESLIADPSTPVYLEFSAPRLPAETETTAYFIVAEALANVVKHAAASQARVRIGINDLSLIIEVSDDCVGGPMRPGAAG